MNDNEYDKFYAKVWTQGDSLIITIPSNIVKYNGYKIGDILKVMTKKKEEE